MKHSLPQRPLRFATAQAYDLSPRGSGRFWVGRSVEQFSLDQPIGPSHGHESTADAVADTRENTARPLNDQDAGVVCTNPLRDQPSPCCWRRQTFRAGWVGERRSRHRHCALVEFIQRPRSLMRAGSNVAGIFYHLL